jgi:Tfp pilus assembly protein PilN
MQYIRAKSVKRTMITISVLAAASALAIFVLLFMSERVFQKVHMNNLQKDIDSSTSELKKVTDLNKVLTVQNQLNSLSSLHDQKPVTSRLFGFMSQTTPSQASIGKLDIDFTAHTIKITGTADTLSTVNKFVDTLKFSTYSYKNSDGSDSTNNKPFKTVVLSSFSRSDKDSTYALDVTFDEAIFDVNKDVKLAVPKIISTRSETEKPTELFKALPQSTEVQP